MAAEYFSVKNLEHYQHYKNRGPRWVKLYREILTDYDLRCHPPLTRLLHVFLIIIASECDNRVPLDMQYLSERSGFPINQDIVTPLFNSGHLLAYHASTIRLHHASTSRVEKRESRAEKKPLTPFPNFDTFWTFYPRKLGKAAALKAWIKLQPDDALLDTILKAITVAKQSPAWLKDNGQFIPHPASWLNGKRWEDELTPPSPTRTFRDLSKVYRDELPSPSHKKPPTSHDHPVT